MRAYEMLNDGASARDLVIALRQTQLAIEGIVKHWNDSGSGQLLIPPVIRVHLESIVGKFQSARELVAQVSDLVATGDRGYRFHRDRRDPEAHPVARGRFFALRVDAAMRARPRLR